MTNIYETTIIVKPDLANDQMKNLNTSIDQFFSENDVSIGYKEDWGIKNLKSAINKYSKGSFKFIFCPGSGGWSYPKTSKKETKGSW